VKSSGASVWLSAVTAEEEQRASEFPELDVGGLSSLNPRRSYLRLFWEVKRDTCFINVRLIAHTMFLALKEVFHHEIKHWGWITRLFPRLPVCSFKAFSTVSTMCSWQRQRESTLVITEIRQRYSTSTLRGSPHWTTVLLLTSMSTSSRQLFTLSWHNKAHVKSR